MRLFKSGSLAHTSGLLGVAALVGRMSALGLLVVLSRAIGQSAVAYYGLATLTASFISLASSLGMSTYATRASAMGEFDQIRLRAIHTARLAFLLLGSVVLFCVLRLSISGGFVVGFELFAVAALTDQWNETAWASIRGTRRAGREPAITATTYVVAIAICVLVWRDRELTFSRAGEIWLFVGMVRSLLACAATQVWPVSTPRIVIATLRQSMGRALPYLGSDILGLAYLRGDTVVLATFVATSQLGNYISAAGYTAPLVQISAAMALGGLAKIGRDGASGNVASLIDFLGGAGAILTSGLTILLPSVVLLMYGPGQRILTLDALILAAFVPLRFYNSALSSVVLLYGSAKSRLFVVLGSVLVNVALNFALDPILGSRGAALATVLTELGVTICFLSMLRKQSTLDGRARWILFCGVICTSVAIVLTFAQLEGRGEIILSIVFAGLLLSSYFLSIRKGRPGVNSASPDTSEKRLPERPLLATEPSSSAIFKFVGPA